MVVAHKSSTEEIGVLRKLFEKYSSHDGSIPFERFCEAMSGHTEEELRTVFDAIVSEVVAGRTGREICDHQSV